MWEFTDAHDGDVGYVVNVPPQTNLTGQAQQIAKDGQAIELVPLAWGFANPAGPVMLAYPFKTVSIGALQDYIAEWQSPNFHSLSVQPFIWLLLVTFAAVGVSRRRLAFSRVDMMMPV